MNSLLFDINHPAHVHYFKNAIRKLQEKGHKVCVVARDKEITYQLLKEENISFKKRGKGGVSVLEKAFYNIKAVKYLKSIISEQDVRLVISFMHPYAAQAAFLSRIPSLLFSDTEQALWHHLFTKSFATEIHTPFVFQKNLGSKHFRFNSFMELAYLNTRDFDLQSLKKYSEGEKSGKKKVFVRFVSRKSMHDLSHIGLSDHQKVQMIQGLANHFEIVISSEVPLPNELKRYQINTSVSEIHYVLGGSDVYVGESATMASESAFLGVPAVYIDDVGRSYTDYLGANYGIIHRVSESTHGVNKAIEIAKKVAVDSFEERAKKRALLCSNYLNTTDYIVSQIERMLLIRKHAD